MQALPAPRPDPRMIHETTAEPREEPARCWLRPSGGPADAHHRYAAASRAARAWCRDAGQVQMTAHEFAIATLNLENGERIDLLADLVAEAPRLDVLLLQFSDRRVRRDVPELRLHVMDMSATWGHQRWGTGSGVMRCPMPGSAVRGRRGLWGRVGHCCGRKPCRSSCAVAVIAGRRKQISSASDLPGCESTCMAFIHAPCSTVHSSIHRARMLKAARYSRAFCSSQSGPCSWAAGFRSPANGRSARLRLLTV
jgi:hypothetical protein